MQSVPVSVLEINAIVGFQTNLKWGEQKRVFVKGQEHIVTTLKNQIKADRIGHAYLFCGTRGTGKTTIAKILAKAVNCEHPVDGSPCNECATCRAINEGTSMNVIEIDAASNNGVDNIREIREEVAYRPTQGNYKVYIIDEVHMLSTGAFNALLKTLEEPPSYVMFILATTEAHKIPITILSRCQRYDFRRITADTISARLMELMDKEGNDVEEKAIRYIAKKGVSGGRMIVRPEDNVTFDKHSNVIAGNVTGFGATSGQMFVAGRAGERFGVRNGGATFVVEGVGDHGCEYMTGGTVVVLGPTGRNFGAGFSGGNTYVLDLDMKKVNPGAIKSGALLFKSLDAETSKLVYALVKQHAEETGSQFAAALLEDWNETVKRFTHVVPKQFVAMTKAMEEAKANNVDFNAPGAWEKVYEQVMEGAR